MNQKKVKFNIVDIIVILILLAGVAFVAVRMFGGQEPAAAADPTGSTYHVTFHTECVREDVANTLVLGSKAENASRNMDLGKLIDFSIDESIVYGTDSKGNVVQSTKPGYVSVTLTCELTGLDQSTGLQVGQFMLNVGHSMGVRCGFTELNMIVQNIAPATAG